MASLPRVLSLTLCLLGVALCATALSPVAPAAPSVDASLLPAGTALQSDSADRPQATPRLELPERVVLSGTTRHGSVRVERDVAASLDGDSTALDGAYQRGLLEEQLSRADGERERQAVLERWATSLNDSLRSLGARERDARQSFQRDGGSPRTLVSNLRAIDARARQIDRIAALVGSEAEENSAHNATDSVEAIQGDVAIRQGRVRQMVGEIGAGERSPTRFYVSASANGTVLATISGGQYHREATRSDLLKARGTTGIAHANTFELTTEQLYPTVHEHYSFFTPSRTIVPFQLYQVVANEPYYPHGELRAYVDGVSETVFWEYQQLYLDSNLPIKDTISTTENGTTLSVDRTYPTGPARVRVRSDGEPINDSIVRVDGVEVDRTQDGVGWVILPYGTSTVSIQHGSQRVETQVSW